jgi:hypothetical protein
MIVEAAYRRRWRTPLGFAALQPRSSRSPLPNSQNFSGKPRPERIQTSDLLVEQVSCSQSWSLDQEIEDLR